MNEVINILADRASLELRSSFKKHTCPRCEDGPEVEIILREHRIEATGSFWKFIKYILRKMH